MNVLEFTDLFSAVNLPLHEHNQRYLTTSNYFRDSPLHIWTEANAYHFCYLLVKNGADVNETNLFGQTPLRTALLQGNDKLAELYLNHGANIDFGVDLDTIISILTKISQKVKDEVFFRGLDINSKYEMGMTVLHQAIMINRPAEVIQILINNGSDIGIKNSVGLTPVELTLAMPCRHHVMPILFKEMTKELCLRGALPESLEATYKLTENNWSTLNFALNCLEEVNTMLDTRLCPNHFYNLYHFLTLPVEKIVKFLLNNKHIQLDQHTKLINSTFNCYKYTFMNRFDLIRKKLNLMLNMQKILVPLLSKQKISDKYKMELMTLKDDADMLRFIDRHNARHKQKKILSKRRQYRFLFRMSTKVMKK